VNINHSSLLLLKSDVNKKTSNISSFWWGT